MEEAANKSELWNHLTKAGAAKADILNVLRTRCRKGLLRRLRR